MRVQYTLLHYTHNSSRSSSPPQQHLYEGCIYRRPPKIRLSFTGKYYSDILWEENRTMFHTFLYYVPTPLAIPSYGSSSSPIYTSSSNKSFTALCTYVFALVSCVCKNKMSGWPAREFQKCCREYSYVRIGILKKGTCWKCALSQAHVRISG